MNQKIKVGILFGGKSAEHEVSLQSAKNIVQAIDKEKYDVVLLGIDKQGRWYLNEQSQFLLNEENPKLISLNKSGENIALVTGKSGVQELISLSGGQSHGKLDVVFPIMHGTYAEDGTIQGLLKLLDIPFVGAGVLGSAASMDKDIMKRLLRDAGLPIGDFLVFTKTKINELNFADITASLGLPFFVKPANLGSSVGIHKVHNEEEFMPAIIDAFQFDTKIIIEETIDGREIECSVLGNENPIASIPGEIIPQHEFYSYEAKYIDESGAKLEVPAKLSEDMVVEIQKLAVQTFQVLCCEGMARVDIFLTKDNEFYVNEINTIPGFTKISMYPKLWELSGINQTELIDKLIQLAIERHENEKQLKTSFEL